MTDLDPDLTAKVAACAEAISLDISGVDADPFVPSEDRILPHLTALIRPLAEERNDLHQEERERWAKTVLDHAAKIERLEAELTGRKLKSAKLLATIADRGTEIESLRAELAEREGVVAGVPDYEDVCNAIREAQHDQFSAKPQIVNATDRVIGVIEQARTKALNTALRERVGDPSEAKHEIRRRIIAIATGLGVPLEEITSSLGASRIEKASAGLYRALLAGLDGDEETTKPDNREHFEGETC